MIHTKLRNRLAMKKLHKLVYVHYNVRLRVKNLMQERSDEDLYNPIDLNHIFNDDDILDEWMRKGEEPILSSDDLDWLDQDLPSREGREAARADDGGTSNRVSRRGSSIAQEKLVLLVKVRLLKKLFQILVVMKVTIEPIEGVATLLVTVKIVKTLVGTMEQVVALEQAVLLIVVMSIKLIMVCRGCREMRIIMPHKILIMDIGQAYGNNESTWKD